MKLQKVVLVFLCGFSSFIGATLDKGLLEVLGRRRSKSQSAGLCLERPVSRRQLSHISEKSEENDNSLFRSHSSPQISLSSLKEMQRQQSYFASIVRIDSDSEGEAVRIDLEGQDSLKRPSGFIQLEDTEFQMPTEKVLRSLFSASDSKLVASLVDELAGQKLCLLDIDMAVEQVCSNYIKASRLGIDKIDPQSLKDRVLEALFSNS